MSPKASWSYGGFQHPHGSIRLASHSGFTRGSEQARQRGSYSSIPSRRNWSAPFPSHPNTIPPSVDDRSAKANRTAAPRASLGDLPQPADPVFIGVGPTYPGVEPGSSNVQRQMLHVVRLLSQEKKAPPLRQECRCKSLAVKADASKKVARLFSCIPR